VLRGPSFEHNELSDAEAPRRVRIGLLSSGGMWGRRRLVVDHRRRRDYERRRGLRPVHDGFGVSGRVRSPDRGQQHVVLRPQHQPDELLWMGGGLPHSGHRRQQ